ncbi:Uncharacterised protein [Streptococcus pneumoniae]|nr:Uncharacterised protein [Streptococcus pneumoniae]
MFSSANTGCENKAKIGNVTRLIFKNRRLFISFSHNYDIDFNIILSNLFQQFKKTSGLFYKLLWFCLIQDMRAIWDNLKLGF